MEIVETSRRSNYTYFTTFCFDVESFRRTIILFFHRCEFWNEQMIEKIVINIMCPIPFSVTIMSFRNNNSLLTYNTLLIYIHIPSKNSRRLNCLDSFFFSSSCRTYCYNLDKTYWISHFGWHFPNIHGKLINYA